MIVVEELKTGKVFVFSVKSDVCRLFKVTNKTLWNWSKERIKEREGFRILFDVTNVVNRTKRRNNNPRADFIENLPK